MNKVKEELKGKSGIYVLRNLVNGKAYIGSTINLQKRKTQHFQTKGINDKHNQYLNHSFAKYGVDNFNFEVLCYVEDKEQLTTIETQYIQLFETHKRGIGYNICPTGFSTLGKKTSDETKKKLSEINKGRIFSEEWKQKISDSKKGTITSNETKAKLSKIKMGINGIKVIQLTIDNIFIAEYPNMTEAVEATRTFKSGIIMCCKGKRKTAHGFKWMYSKDYNN